jgi:hypothetical protein
MFVCFLKMDETSQLLNIDNLIELYSSSRCFDPVHFWRNIFSLLIKYSLNENTFLADKKVIVIIIKCILFSRHFPELRTKCEHHLDEVNHQCNLSVLVEHCQRTGNRKMKNAVDKHSSILENHRLPRHMK